MTEAAPVIDPEDVPINQFHGFDHPVSYLPHDFWFAVFVFGVIAVALVWGLRRLFPSLGALTASLFAGAASVSLVYPVRAAFWYLEDDPYLKDRPLAEALVQYQDRLALPLAFVVVSTVAFAFAYWLDKRDLRSKDGVNWKP